MKRRISYWKGAGNGTGSSVNRIGKAHSAVRERAAQDENMDKEINDKEKDGAKPTTLECKPPVFFATLEEVRKHEAARASKRAQDGENDINVDGSDSI